MPFQLFGDLFTARLVRVSMLIAVVVLCRWSARLARAAQTVVTGEVGSFRPRPQTNGTDGKAVDERWVVGLFTAAVAFSPAIFAAGLDQRLQRDRAVGVHPRAGVGDVDRGMGSGRVHVESAARGRGGGGLGGDAHPGTDRYRRGARDRGVRGGARLAQPRPTGCGPDGWRSSAALLPLIAHAAVNFAKFGTLFSVPGGRQLLSLQDPARAAWFAGNNESFFSSRFLSTTVVQYLRPDAIRFERLLPFVRFGPVGRTGRRIRCSATPRRRR